MLVRIQAELQQDVLRLLASGLHHWKIGSNIPSILCVDSMLQISFIQSTNIFQSLNQHFSDVHWASSVMVAATDVWMISCPLSSFERLPGPA